MSVLFIGGRWVLDHLREKHDFEMELSRTGFRHEEFTLHVKSTSASGTASDVIYDVKVKHGPTQTVRVYHGGPQEDWVACFTKDLAGGLYGHPIAASAPHRAQREAARYSGHR